MGVSEAPARDRPIEPVNPNSRSLPKSARVLDLALSALAIVVGGIQAWNYRYSFSSTDIVSYLDVGDMYLRGDWNSAINGYWSPFYSWALALAQTILKMPDYLDPCRVKLVNFCIFLAALGAFRFFLHHLIVVYGRRLVQDGKTADAAPPTWSIIIAGYFMFFWSAFRFTGLFCDTPDMCTSTMVYCACGMILRHQSGAVRVRHFAILGAVLGLGYLSKTANFPLAFVFIFTAAYCRDNYRQGLVRVLAGLTGMALVAAPYISALSLSKDRLTFGDTGKLNLIWYVHPGRTVIDDIHWQGGPAANGMPVHPTRKLLTDPDLFEFSEPVGGTLPLWTDPSYWYEGARFEFVWIRHLQTVKRNLIVCWHDFLKVFLMSCGILALAGGCLRQSLGTLCSAWRIVIPMLAGLGIYMICMNLADLVTPCQSSMRLISPFVAVLGVTAFATLRIGPAPRSQKLFAAAAVCGAAFASFALYPVIAAEVNSALELKKENGHARLAEAMVDLGIGPGDQIAVLGDCDPQSLWARLAKVKIVAHIPDADCFRSNDGATRVRIFRVVAATGAKAIIQSSRPDPGDPITWRRAGNSEFYVHLFDETYRTENRPTAMHR